MGHQDPLLQNEAKEGPFTVRLNPRQRFWCLSTSTFQDEKYRRMSGALAVRNEFPGRRGQGPAECTPVPGALASRGCSPSTQPVPQGHTHSWYSLVFHMKQSPPVTLFYKLLPNSIFVFFTVLPENIKRLISPFLFFFR